MAALCDRKARPEQPFGEVRIIRCLRVRPKSEFTAEKVCSTETNAAGTHSAGTNAAETNATETNATETHSAEMNAAGTNATETNEAGTNAAERVAAFCCSAAFRRHAPRTTHHAPRAPQHAPRTTRPAPRTTHPAPRTTHPALRTKQPPAVFTAPAVKTVSDEQSAQPVARSHRCTCHKKHMREMFGLILLPK